MKNSLSKISVLILCGGFGKRLQPVVPDRQKAIANVNRHPFITFILDQISGAGCEDVILCTGFRSEQVEDLLGNRYKTLSLRYSRENEPLGTAGAIRNALNLIQSDTVIIFNGDSYCNIKLQDLIGWYFSKKSLCTLTLVKVLDVSRYGSVSFESDYRITSFNEKKVDHKSGWINGGIYCIARKLVESMQEKQNISFEKDFFPKMIGNRLFAFPQNTDFIDIGTPDSYKEATTFFRNIKKVAEPEKIEDYRS